MYCMCIYFCRIYILAELVQKSIALIHLYTFDNNEL